MNDIDPKENEAPPTPPQMERPPMPHFSAANMVTSIMVHWFYDAFRWAVVIIVNVGVLRLLGVEV